MLSTFFGLAATAVVLSALNNGRGKLPAMSYNTYNAFAENHNTSVVEVQARVMRDTEHNGKTMRKQKIERNLLSFYIFLLSFSST
jgi:hypothetical protein